jgi:hypothetical protein
MWVCRDLIVRSILLFLLQFPTVFSKIHDHAKRRLFVRANLNQVLISAAGKVQRIGQRKHAKLITGLIYDLNLFRFNYAIDPGLYHGVCVTP